MTKFHLLISLLFSAPLVVNGKSFWKTKQESLPALVDAPDMVVYYLNKKAVSTACSEAELLHIDNRMLPDIDNSLTANNFEAPDWQIASNDARRDLAAAGSASNAPNCDICRTRFSRSLCSVMYNCRLRRQLRSNQERTLQNFSGLASDLINKCQNNIDELSDSAQLSVSCQKAIKHAKCYVEFV
jgi:hypothetical protein